MTLTTIEKAAKLMGYEPLGTNIYGVFEVDKQPENKQPHTASTFNPYTNKADLSDVIDELGINVLWWHSDVTGTAHYGRFVSDPVQYANHPDKFTARANAVMDVVSQIYDRREG